MDRLKAYILSNFTKSFITLFVPFFIIMSLIYIINISKLSSKMVITSKDFMILYTYVLPDIIFVTLPLAFLGAIINMLSNLSENNELIAIFSIGYTPKKILSYLIILTILFTLIVSTLSLFITPYTTQKMQNYRNRLIYESNLKVLPKKLSQSFGNHHIFIDENKNGKFKNITMFTKQGNNSQILLAKSGFIKNDLNSSSYLNLNNGLLYRYKKDGFTIIDYKNLKLFNNSKYLSNKILDTKDYWLKHKGKLYYYILISLSPILLLLFYFSLAIFNPRYQRNKASISIIISILMIYIPAIIARKIDNIYTLTAIIIFWITISIFLFYKNILKRY